MASKEMSLYIQRPAADPADSDAAAVSDGWFGLSIVAPDAVDLCSPLRLQARLKSTAVLNRGGHHSASSDRFMYCRLKFLPVPLFVCAGSAQTMRDCIAGSRFILSFSLHKCGEMT